MGNDLDRFLERVRRLRAKAIPSSDQIVTETFLRLGITREQLSPEDVRANFNHLLADVFRETLVTLEDYERPTYSSGAIRELTQLREEDVRQVHADMKKAGADEAAFKRAVESLMERWYYYLRQLFLSVSQSRKTRGGRDFELQLGRLLTLAGFPFEEQHQRHRVDFMLPGYAHYAKDRSQCVLLSAKRTLRERWQQVVDELHKMNCPNVFLATTDDKISASKVKDISARNIKLVVFDQVKSVSFPTEAMVIGYTDLANSVLPQWQNFW